MLRFKRDDGTNYPEWEEKDFLQVIETFEYGMNVAATKYDGKIKYLRITDIDETTHRYLTKDIVSPSGKLDDKYLVKEGDIFFARTGASVGKTYLYRSEDGKMYFAGFLIRGHIKEQFVPYYIFCQTLTEKYKKWVKIMSVRSGQPGINSQEYSSYKFLCSVNKEEQQKIADFLLEVDNIIDASEQEIESLERQKKGAMQKIFSQEVRFKADDGSEYPEWKEEKLGNILEICHGKDYKLCKSIHKNYPVLGTGGVITYIDEYLCDWECVLIGRKGTIDKPIYMNTPFWCVDTLFFSKPKSNQNVKFQYYLYQTINWKKYNEASGVPSLNASTIENIKVYVPHIDEQKKIAEFFSELDNAIECAKKELEIWNNIKKGLLQQIFN